VASLALPDIAAASKDYDGALKGKAGRAGRRAARGGGGKARHRNLAHALSACPRQLQRDKPVVGCSGVVCWCLQLSLLWHKRWAERLLFMCFPRKDRGISDWCCGVAGCKCSILLVYVEDVQLLVVRGRDALAVSHATAGEAVLVPCGDAMCVCVCRCRSVEPEEEELTVLQQLLDIAARTRRSAWWRC